MEKEAEKRVLRGSLEKLPPLNSRLVRIFISSTFTDTVLERNMLMQEVYPKMKDFCKRKYGLDFQVVDMRWGVRKEASDDHSTSGLCLQEIHNCQKLSMGPNFVTFLGQKHGYRPLQSNILSSEFERLRETLIKHQQDVSLLDSWYLKDENAIPPIYVLQPISSLIPEDENRRRTWQVISNSLKNSLKFASLRCFEEGLIDSDTKHKYFMSVTEEEIIHGVLKSESDPSHSCLCFIRIIEDLTSHLTDTKAWRFIDMQDSTIDSEAQQLLKNLRDEKVVKTVKKPNIHNVLWSEGEGIDPDKHRDYLKTFSDQFYNGVTERIDKAMKAHKKTEDGGLFVEVLQHSLMAVARCDAFHGREDILEKVKSHVTSNSALPLVVYGDSGCGKTSIMAMAASQIPKWNRQSKSPVVVLRFLGTSPQSSTVRKLLHSICYQLCANYGPSISEIPSELNELLSFFNTQLKNVPETMPLTLILDSLDQLSGENFAHKLNWLPKDIPPNVCVIVSTLPRHFNILDRLRSWLKEDCFVNVPALGEELSHEVLQSWLSRRQRSLTDKQMNLVKIACEKCSLPLYVKLLFEKVILWHSYEKDETELILQHTLKDSIKSLFKRLETKHGSLLVQHALAYITASQNGLSEVELEDILSLDDDVLNDVFQFHIPPVRRIPPLIWVRIRNDISAYLVDKEADDTRVFFWYHRQFIEAAQDRYLQDRTFSNMIHSAIADYFIGKWHRVSKPFVYTSSILEKLSLKESTGSADRKVAAQPLTFGTVEDGTDIRYNRRKLNQLPYHLALAGRREDLKELCLFNYQFLYTKLSATSIQQVLDDFISMTNDPESVILEKALSMSQSAFNKTPDSLSLEISGRLLPYIAHDTNKFPFLYSLLKECFLDGASRISVIPRQQCFPAPGGPIHHLLEHPDLPVGSDMVILSPDSQHIFALTKMNMLLMWDLQTGEVEKQQFLLPLEEGKLNVMKQTLDQKHIIVGSVFQRETNTNPIIIIDCTTGEILEFLQLHKISLPLGFTDSLTFGLTEDKILLIIMSQYIHCFSRQNGEFLKEFPIKCDHNLVLSNEKRAIFPVQQNNDYEVYDLEKLEKCAVISCELSPMKILASGAGNKQGFIIFKNSHHLQVVNLDFKSQEFGKTIFIIACTKFISDPIRDISVSVDSKRLIIMTKSGIVLWNLESKKFLKTFLIPNEIIPKRKVLAFKTLLSPDGSMLISTFEEYLLFWTVHTGHLIQIIPADKSQLIQLLLTLDGKLAVTSSKNNNNIKIWKMDLLNEETFQPLSMKSSCRYLSVASTANLMVARSNQPDDLAVVDALYGNVISRPSKEFDVLAPTISPDGESVVSREYTSESAVKIWSSRTGNLEASLSVSSIQLKLLAISRDSSKVVTISESELNADVVAKVWLMSTGQIHNTIHFGKGFVNQVYFALNDTALVVSRQKNDSQDVQNLEVAVYDVQSCNKLVTFTNIKRETLTQLDHDSSKVLFVQTFCKEKSDEVIKETLVILSLETGKLTMVCEDAPVNRRVSVSTDGSKAIDAGKSVYDLLKGKKMFKFEEETTKRFHLPQLNPDGSLAAWICNEPGLFKIASVKQQRILSVCPTHSLLMCLYITKDNVITMGCEDGRIMLLQLCKSEENAENLFLESVQREKELLCVDLHKNTDRKKSSACQLF